MPYQSRWKTVIPNETLPTFMFGSPHLPLSNISNTPLLMDARSPEHHWLSRRTYRLWSQRFAAGLQAAGMRKGDRLLLFSGNSIFVPVVLVGTVMAGGVFTGANPAYTPRELAYQISDSGAKFLICAEAALDTGLAAAKTANLPKSSIFVFDDGPATFHGRGQPVNGIRHWSSIIAEEEDAETFVWEELDEQGVNDTVATLNYSSGTTGVPKGVMITHKNYVANAAQMEFQAMLDPEYQVKKERMRLLCFLPLYHAMAQTIFGINAMKSQIPVYMMPKFDFLEMLQNVQKFRITHLVLVPPVVVAMAKHPAVRKFDLSSVESVGSGAAPLGREVCVELEKLWPPGRINVKQGWGMTELTCSATGWLPHLHSESFSVGELNANVEAKIVDDNDKEVPHGERGEILIRGPNVMKGYWRKPEATRETITPDGWLRTGDIAYLDKHNRFFIVDRKKELIKVKGNQVAPAELEAILLEHDAIADTAVIGITLENEEHPRAYIVLNEGKSATENEIQDWMAGHVARHKRLTGGVKFVDTIPKNPSGKILRKILRDQARAEQAGKTSKL